MGLTVEELERQLAAAFHSADFADACAARMRDAGDEVAALLNWIVSSEQVTGPTMVAARDAVAKFAAAIEQTPASVGDEYAPFRAFVDTWSRWGLNHYVATDSTTRTNLTAMRVYFNLEEVDATESWNVDREYAAMDRARDALSNLAAIRAKGGR